MPSGGRGVPSSLPLTLHCLMPSGGSPTYRPWLLKHFIVWCQVHVEGSGEGGCGWRFAAHVTVWSKLIIKIVMFDICLLTGVRFLYKPIHVLFTYFDCIHFNYMCAMIWNWGMHNKCRRIVLQAFLTTFCLCGSCCYSKIFHLHTKSVFTDCFFFPLQEVFRALQFQQNFPLKSLQKLKYFVSMLVTVLQSTARLMIQVQMFLFLFLNTCHHTIYQACKEG